VNLPQQRLAELERAVDRALAGDETALEVLGYGEVSCVLALEHAGERLALKRMPPFGTRARADGYAEIFARYLEALAAAGVPVVPSELTCVERDDATHVVYCVQPVLPAAALGPRRFAAGSDEEVAAMFGEIAALVGAAVGPRLGIDGQLSNWAWIDGRATLLDVTTPFLRDDAGRDLLDTEMYIEALPWLMRGLVRRFLLKGIFDKYHDARGVVLDLLGNLHKERLGRLVPALARRAGIDEAEVARYYASDRRLWAMLQAARRLDRAWQRRIRRRTYPYLLPGAIQR
jgi:hypothetical protein